MAKKQTAAVAAAASRRIHRPRPPLSAAAVRRSGRPGTGRPGPRQRPEIQPRRPRLPVHRRPRRRQDQSTARILAKALNCVKGPTADALRSVRHLPGASPPARTWTCSKSTGPATAASTRSARSAATCSTGRSRSRYKIYIIDEVHMLTGPAFNALLKTLEEPPPHVKFIFATTEVQKIPVTILSRCQRFDFARHQHRPHRRTARRGRRGREACRPTTRHWSWSPAGPAARCATPSRCSISCWPSAATG